jgi:hypothetical protein
MALLWRLMVPTLRVIDRLCQEMEQPVTEIVSAYRCPAYNARDVRIADARDDLHLARVRDLEEFLAELHGRAEPVGEIARDDRSIQWARDRAALDLKAHEARAMLAG